MPQCFVLGKPIEHSLSPVLHEAGYQALGLDTWSYGRMEATAETLPQIVAEADREVAGFSVTMPGKFAALRTATTATDRARLIGSANTLVRNGEGWLADNTDAEGVTGALEELLGDKEIHRALVIGAGGTARPALWALAERGVTRVDVLNRSNRMQELSSLLASLSCTVHPWTFQDEIEELAESADVIISTVPSAAIAGHVHALAHAPVFDVIYDPFPTPLMVNAAANGFPTVGGHIMLANQAYSQFEQFTGHPAPRAEMRTALFAALNLPAS